MLLPRTPLVNAIYGTRKVSASSSVARLQNQFLNRSLRISTSKKLHLMVLNVRTRHGKTGIWMHTEYTGASENLLTSNGYVLTYPKVSRCRKPSCHGGS